MNAPRHSKLGIRIAQLRLMAGMATQADLARRVKTTQQSISRWEAGTSRPREAQLDDLANALLVDPAQLRELAGYGNATPLTYAVPFPVDRLDPEKFERIVEWILRARHPEAEVRRAGKTGHKQDGEDVSVLFPDGELHSYQCKRHDQFGPGKVKAAVDAYTGKASKKVLVLSRIASPQAVEAIRAFPGWELWDMESLTSVIRDLPKDDQIRLVDIFFRGQREALLGEREPGAWLTPEQYFEPFESQGAVFDLATHFEGREADLAKLDQKFAQDGVNVIILNGAGGVGKSRLLREFLDRYHTAHRTTRIRVLSLADQPTRKNLDDLGGGPKLLVVDDAHTRDTLTSVLDYVAVEANQAKLLISTRPYALSRILRETSAYKVDPPPVIELGALSAAEAVALTGRALADYDLDESWAEPIARASSNLPLIALMMTKVIAKEGLSLELAKNAEALRNQVLAKFGDAATDIGSESDKRQLRSVVDVLSVVQPFHIEDPQLFDLIATVTAIPAIDASRFLRMLLEGGVIYQRSQEYRLMPDLMADYYIEKSCIAPSGKLSPFADAILDAMPASLLGNVLVNLGRLDWRLTSGDPSNSRLLDGMWQKLRSIDTAYDGRLDAIAEVAVFQPRQALDFVRAAMAEKRLIEALPTILRNVAFAYDYVEETCALLWELGRDDPRETGPHPQHALRVLTDLAGYQVQKPVPYNEKVLDFALGLLDRPEAWKGAHTPLEVLAPILSGEGMTTTSDRRQFTMTPFFVSFDVVRPLRAKLIDHVIDRLPTAEGKRGHRLGMFLSNALRSPHGMLGSSPESSLRRKYKAEFVDTLRRVRAVVEAGGLDAMTAIGIAGGVSWHVQHATGAEADEAKAIFAALPSDLEFRTRAGLMDGWGHTFIGLRDVPQWDTETKKWMRSITDDLRAAFPDPEALLAHIERALLDVRAVSADASSAFVLINEVLADNLPLAKALLADAQTRRQSPMRDFVSNALGVWLRADRQGARGLTRKFLTSGDTDLAAAAAASLSYFRDPEAEDIALLSIGLASADARVASWAVNTLSSWRELSERALLDLTRLVQFTDASMAEQVARLWTGFHRETILDASTREDAEHFLERARRLPELNGHWLETLLSEFSVRHPFLLVEWFFDRVEHAADMQSFDMRPINYGPYVHVPLRFSESGQGIALQRRVWEWLRSHADEKNFYLEHHAAHLHDAFFLGSANDVVQFFEPLIESASASELTTISKLLKEASQTFIFTHRAFVIRYLERCRAVDRDTYELASERLWSSAVSGVRGGIVGEPTPQDLRMRDSAMEALKVMTRSSAAWELYDNVRRDAERNIERSRREGLDFD